MQTIEDEAARRIEFLVKKRVEEELEKRKDEIELEVNRRVEAAKAQMEREMMLELEKRREAARLEEQKREVNIFIVVVRCNIWFAVILVDFFSGISSTGSTKWFNIYLWFSSIQEISIFMFASFIYNNSCKFNSNI